MLRDRALHNPEPYEEYKLVSITRGEKSGQRIVFQDRWFDFDFGVQELLGSHHTAVELQSTALYGYARFFGDTDVTRTYHVSQPDVTWVIKPGIWNGVKRLLARGIQAIHKHEREGHNKHVAESGIEFDIVLFPWFFGWPTWLMPKAHRMDSIRYDEYQIKVDRIQEALTSQIIMLYRLNLPPRAVLASPDIVDYIAAADMPLKQGDYATVSKVGGTNTFMGVPVIECREMTHGAIVI